MPLAGPRLLFACPRRGAAVVTACGAAAAALLLLLLSAAALARWDGRRRLLTARAERRAAAPAAATAAWLVASDASLRLAEVVEGSPLLVPALRLAYCSVPKAASTVLKRLFLRANGLPTWSSGDENVVHRSELSGMGTMRGLPAAAANALLRDAAWTRLVVVRDPVERFASAFLNKCRASARNPVCPLPPGDAARDDPRAVLAALEAAVQVPSDSPHRNQAAAAFDGVHALNAHFMPQALLCDLRLALPAYTVLTYHELRRQGLARVLPMLRPAADAHADLLANVLRWAASAISSSSLPGGDGSAASDADGAEALRGTNRTHARALAREWRAMALETGSGAAVAAAAAAAADFLRRLECFFRADYELFAEHLSPPVLCR